MKTHPVLPSDKQKGREIAPSPLMLMLSRITF